MNMPFEAFLPQGTKYKQCATANQLICFTQIGLINMEINKSREHEICGSPFLLAEDKILIKLNKTVNQNFSLVKNIFSKTNDCLIL